MISSSKKGISKDKEKRMKEKNQSNQIMKNKGGYHEI